MITSKVGLEVGSFYYHFASKDEVMEAAIDLFFASYEEQMRLIVHTDRENPRGCLQDILTISMKQRKTFVHNILISCIGAFLEQSENTPC